MTHTITQRLRDLQAEPAKTQIRLQREDELLSGLQEVVNRLSAQYGPLTMRSQGILDLSLSYSHKQNTFVNNIPLMDLS